MLIGDLLMKIVPVELLECAMRIYAFPCGLQSWS